MREGGVAAFEAHRTHLLNIAYRMLGEMSTAEDVVQDAWLRWHGADRQSVRDDRAWLSTATARLALDALRRAKVRRETYVGPWLPEPVLPDDMRALTADSAVARAELASDLSLDAGRIAELLAPDVIFHSDGGGRVPAALNSILGSDKVSRLLMGLLRKQQAGGNVTYRPTDINGRTGLLILVNDAVDTAVVFECDDKHITAIHAVRNPDKLARMTGR